MVAAVPQCPLTPIALWFRVLVEVDQVETFFFFFFVKLRKILWNSSSLSDRSRHNCSVSVTLLWKLLRDMEVDYHLLSAEAQLCWSCLCLLQRGHDLLHATWKSSERFPMARTTLQLCNEVLLLEVCENRSCELAGSSELKFFHILTPKGFFGKFNGMLFGTFLMGVSVHVWRRLFFLVIPF